MSEMPGPNPYAQPPHPMSAGTVPEWERTYAMFTHLSLLAVHVLVPVLPALVMWLIKRDQSKYVDDHGKEAVNFQISLLLYWLLSIPLMFACGAGYVLAVATWVLGVVGMILASVAANQGRYYRYPACLRLIG